MNSAIAPRPIRRAYEQVYDQLLEGMLGGTLADGERLPSEPEMAAAFGVSRATVRGALGLLHREGLIRTVKGAHGGSFVTLPTIGDVSDFLQRKIELLSLKADLTLDEFLEARRLVEVFAVRQAATRQAHADMAALRSTVTAAEGRDDDPVAGSAHAQNARNRQFHIALVNACGNALIRIAAQPVFTVLHTHLERSALPPDFPLKVSAEHRPILAAIEAGDADAAERLMIDHLDRLSGIYREIWRTTGRSSLAPASGAPR